MCLFYRFVLVLFSTKFAGHLAVRIGQSSVLGGIILGPALLGWVHDTELLTTFSQIGVLLLMFLAGFKTELQEMNSN